MPTDIRWIRSYVLSEESESLGTVCVYEASSPEAIREHASRADLPVTEIIPIADTVIVRPDPSRRVEARPCRRSRITPRAMRRPCPRRTRGGGRQDPRWSSGVIRGVYAGGRSCFTVDVDHLR
jgi:hypothetical protein